ncbi:hypothetical protein RRG08_058020 [Elysia crispata]|uniref:Uncharacterized protein n=1 Tax=Elysia crispata TaxID=231223 RepID=A0AAE1E3M2_9GAST|nr:hypothetical protein RRG08_058020 [Elysia crispata]
MGRKHLSRLRKRSYAASCSDRPTSKPLMPMPMLGRRLRRANTLSIHHRRCCDPLGVPLNSDPVSGIDEACTKGMGSSKGQGQNFKLQRSPPAQDLTVVGGLDHLHQRSTQ